MICGRLSPCKFDIRVLSLALLLSVLPGLVRAQILGDPVDISTRFNQTDQTYFLSARVASFDVGSGMGELQWDRYRRQPSLSFNKFDLPFVRAESDEFPATEYDRDPVLPFSVDFVSPQTVRLRFSTRFADFPGEPSLMLPNGVVPSGEPWSVSSDSNGTTFSSSSASLRLDLEPFRITLFDADGKVLTRTLRIQDAHTFAKPIPFSFVRRALDMSRNTAAAFELAHDEMIFGAGESSTRLNKRGQKINATIRDGMGAEAQWMYKPIPFFMSSRGYGIFVHTSTPVTFDFGHDFDQSNLIYTGDEFLDLFVFVGSPKEILSEYTSLTGRSPVPPLWSFGLWMSRITYETEDEVRAVADKLRTLQIPSDVIHIDTGWFETDWRNNYEFSTTRFSDPAGMISDLRQEGFHISLWQLPYFSQKNSLYDEIVEKGYSVTNAGGRLPFEDAILDFSNPDAVTWYKNKIKGLLDLGVGAIKVDFGEDAPLHGVYHSGRTGWYERNLYPLRYNKAVSDITAEVTGERIIWARSAWAGSQRYPVHWGGDAEITNQGMAGTLRAGLSLGLSGFTYWSHDIGGFTARSPRDLYRRWAAFGALTSHSRVHGVPPREPWTYDEELLDDFRTSIELKYRLLPYIYAQSVESSNNGYPVLRSLFFEFPDDPTSWMIEDQYMLGSDFLVAPFFDDRGSREVYLPPGEWIDYQTGQTYTGEMWHQIDEGEIPIVLMVRSGAVVAHAALVQHTDDIDWHQLSLHVFTTDHETTVSGFVAIPGGTVGSVEFAPTDTGYRLVADPFAGTVDWTIKVLATD
jgi:alpha-D-xyloside xylohydrolase